MVLDQQNKDKNGKIFFLYILDQTSVILLWSLKLKQLYVYCYTYNYDSEEKQNIIHDLVYINITLK